MTQEEPAIRAEDLSFALLAVLERLAPTERVVFVLRSAFNLTFEEIAPIVHRNTVSCRKIFSRARTRMRQERPRFAVDQSRHRALLQSFADAARSGDRTKLVAILDDEVVLHGDGGGKVFANKKPIVGKDAVAQFIIAVTRTVASEAAVIVTEINGMPGLVLAADGRPTVAIMIDTDGERIHSVFAVANPDKLDAIAPVAASRAGRSSISRLR